MYYLYLYTQRSQLRYYISIIILIYTIPRRTYDESCLQNLRRWPVVKWVSDSDCQYWLCWETFQNWNSKVQGDVPARNAGCTLNVSKEIRNRPCSYSYSLLVFTVELNHLLWCAIVVTDREITRYLLNFVNTRPLRYFF